MQNIFLFNLAYLNIILYTYIVVHPYYNLFNYIVKEINNMSKLSSNLKMNQNISKVRSNELLSPDYIENNENNSVTIYKNYLHSNLKIFVYTYLSLFVLIY